MFEQDKPLPFIWESFIEENETPEERGRVVQIIVSFYEDICFYEALWGIMEPDDIHYLHIADIDLRVGSDCPLRSPLYEVTINIEEPFG